MRYLCSGTRLMIVFLLVFAVIGTGTAVPAWLAEHLATEVTGEVNTYQCSDPVQCLEAADDESVYVKKTPTSTERGIVHVPGMETEVHTVTLHVLTRASNDGVGEIEVWDQGNWVEIASGIGEVTEDDEEGVWYTYDITEQASTDSEGNYRIRFQATGLDEWFGFDTLNLTFNYTKTGTLTYDTGNSDDAPVLDPSQIYVGEWSTIFSEVVCSGGYCGNVKSSLTVDGTDIEVVDGLTLIDGDNPQTAVLCDGVPDSGSCDTSELQPEWDVEGVETGLYVIGVSTVSDYMSGDDSSTSALNVSQEPKSLSVTVSATPESVITGDTVTVTGKVTCHTDGSSCTDVDLHVSPAGSNEPFSTVEDTKKSCNNVANQESCERFWELTAEEAGTHTITVTASSSDVDIEDVSVNATVTVLTPSVSMENIGIDGSSTELQKYYAYKTTVPATVTCTLNEITTCDTVVDDTDGSITTSRCSVATPQFGDHNVATCDIGNETYGVEDTYTRQFDVAGKATDLFLSKTTVQVGEQVEVSCLLVNDAPIDFDAGAAQPGNSRVKIRLAGPDGYQMQEIRTDKSLFRASGEEKLIRQSFTIPEEAPVGEWAANCGDYELIQSRMLDRDGVTASFTVEEEPTTGIDVNILSPNPSNEYATGQRIEIAAEVTDMDGQPTEAQVRATDGRDEIILVDDGSGADRVAGDSIYTARVRVPDEGSVYRVTVTAQKSDVEDQTTASVGIRQGISIDRVDMRDTYIVGDAVNIRGEITAYRGLEHPRLSVEFIGPDRNVQGVRETKLEGSAFIVRHQLTSDSPIGGWRAVVKIQDNHGSASTTETFEVNRPQSGAFYLEFIEPNDASDDTMIRRGAAFDVHVRPVDSRTGTTVSLTGLECRLANRTIEIREQDDHFFGQGEIPEEMMLGSYPLYCAGTRTVNSEQIERNRSIQMEVLPSRLDVGIDRSSQLRSGEETTIQVNLSGGNQSVTNATVRVYFDGEPSSYTLKDRGDGTYVGQVLVPEDVNSVSVRAEDHQGNVGDSQQLFVESAPDRLDSVLLSIISIMILGFVFASYFVYLRYGGDRILSPQDWSRQRQRRKIEHLEEQIDDLKRKKTSVQESMKDAERNYYQRKVDKETYLQMMKEYEQEKTRVANELEELYLERVQMENELSQESSEKEEQQGTAETQEKTE